MKTISSILAALLVATGMATAAAAESTALGRDGSLYRLRVLTQEQLYGTVADSIATDPVLVLEVLRSGQPAERLAVPGTAGPDVESFAYLAYEESSDTVFVTWEQRTNLIHSQIFLARYGGGQWSEAIPISDQRFSSKSSPRVVVTRDSFRGLAGGGDAETEAVPAPVQRIVLHVVWLEARGDGTYVVYVPLVLLDGAYSGSYPRIDLLNLFAEEEAPAASVETQWNLPPTVRPSRDNGAVVVGVVDPQTGEVSTFRISILSGELAALADEMRAHIIDVGAQYDAPDPEELHRLAGEMRAHIIDVGARMDRPLVRLVGDDMRAHIIDVGAHYDRGDPEELQRFADDMRAHIIDVGFRLDGRGLSPRREVRAATLGLIGGDGEAAGGERPDIIVRVEEALAGMVLPELQDEPSLFLSGSGERVLIAWPEEGQLCYRESTYAEGADGWGAVRTLHLSDELSFEDAQGVLRDYVESR